MNSFIFLILLLCLLACEKQNKPIKTPKDKIPLEQFSHIIKQEMDRLEVLVHTDLIKNHLIQANKNNADIDPSTIDTLDKNWTKSPQITPLMKKILINPCSKKMRQFQNGSPSLVEIFITDAQGLNVCISNRTSDYYQADEEWWSKTFNNGKGKNFFGKVEYDDSAHSQAIPIYLAIKENEKVIGIVKAVLDLNLMKQKN